MSISPADRHSQAAEVLGAHPDYRVLRRLRPIQSFHSVRPQASSRVAVAVDVETTGLDREADHIIELAIQRC